MLFATFLIAKAEEGPPPLIDVDKTLLLQFGLFLLMYIVLRALVFKPYMRLRADRKQGIEGAREEAHSMDERARKMVADYDAQLGRARQRGADERARLRSEAAASERQTLGAARDEAGRAVDEARGKIAKSAEAARVTLAAQAKELARKMAHKIIGREVLW